MLNLKTNHLTKIFTSGAAAISVLAGIGLADLPAQAILYPTDQGPVNLSPNDFIQSVPVCSITSSVDSNPPCKNVIGDQVTSFSHSQELSGNDFFVGLFQHTLNDKLIVWELGAYNPGADEAINVSLGNWNGSSFNQVGNTLFNQIFKPTNPISPNTINALTLPLSLFNLTGTVNAVRIASNGQGFDHPDISGAASPLAATVPESSSTLGLLALGTLGAGATLKRKFKSSKSTEKETIKVG